MALENQNDAAERADALAREYQEFLRSSEYQAAVRGEGENRELSFIDGPETVCGIPLRPLTAIDLAALSAIESPFISNSFLGGANRVIPHAEIAKFLWVQSVEFRRLKTWRDRWAWRRFIRRCRKINYGVACDSIRQFINDALCDCPGGKDGGVSPASWIACVVHLVASKYHWSEKDILAIPLKRLFQYERCLLFSAGQKASLFSRADAIKGKWLDSVNARNGAN